MGNNPLTYAPGSTYQGYYWSAYKQTQDYSHSKYKATDGTGYTIRGFFASDGMSSPQRRPYAHWGTGYAYDGPISWKCAMHGYNERFATLGAVNSTTVPRIVSPDNTLNAWGMRNSYCYWSFGFICLAKSGCQLEL
jgi:hypothetical protein